LEINFTKVTIFHFSQALFTTNDFFQTILAFKKENAENAAEFQNDRISFLDRQSATPNPLCVSTIYILLVRGRCYQRFFRKILRRSEKVSAFWKLKKIFFISKMT